MIRSNGRAALLLALLAACAVPDATTTAPVSATASSVGPATYQWIPLGPLGGGGVGGVGDGGISWPDDLNDQNQVVGHVFYTNLEQGGPRHAFLWQNGVMTDLGTLGGASSLAHDINEAGVIVGWSSTNGGPTTRAARWTNGVIEALDAGDETSSALRINERGDILGSIGSSSVLWVGGVPQPLPITGVDLNDNGDVVGSALVDSTQHAMLWRDGVVTDLGTFGGVESWPTDVTNSGIVSGTYRMATGEQHAFRWRDGVADDLGPLPGDTHSTGVAANESGQVTGGSSPSARGVLWNGTSAIDLGSLGRNPTEPGDINEDGVVIGTSRVNGFGGLISRRAFAWRDGVMHNLGTGNGSYSTGIKVNNNGWVIGATEWRTNSNMWSAAVWVPVGAAPVP